TRPDRANGRRGSAGFRSRWSNARTLAIGSGRVVVRFPGDSPWCFVPLPSPSVARSARSSPFARSRASLATRRPPRSRTRRPNASPANANQAANQNGDCSMSTLYTSPGAAGLVVHWLLIELGVPHELKILDFEKKEQKSPEYLKLNPAGVVPTLVLDGQVLTEAAAIV